MQDLLKQLKQEELLRLDSERDKIKKTYENLPAALERASKLLSMPPDFIIRVCSMASRNYADMEWYHMLDYMVTFSQCINILNNEE